MVNGNSPAQRFELLEQQGKKNRKHAHDDR
jgi:hypothetical protein